MAALASTTARRNAHQQGKAQAEAFLAEANVYDVEIAKTAVDHFRRVERENLAKVTREGFLEACRACGARLVWEAEVRRLSA